MWRATYSAAPAWLRLCRRIALRWIIASTDTDCGVTSGEGFALVVGAVWQPPALALRQIAEDARQA